MKRFSPLRDREIIPSEFGYAVDVIVYLAFGMAAGQFLYWLVEALRCS